MHNVRATGSNQSGSLNWILEKICIITFLPSVLYVMLELFVFTADLQSFDRYFISIINSAITVCLVLSILCLSFLRGRAIFWDYISHAKLRFFCTISLLLMNIFLFIMIFMTIMYYHMMSSLLVL